MIEPLQDKIKILVVDDSAFMRSAIKGMLGTEPTFEVVGTARDGQECLEKIQKLEPDVVTMDLEMPRMDGLTALKFIMEHFPLPVIVVSSLTTESAAITLEALDMGAMDFVCKDLQSRSLNVMNIEDTLIGKIKGIIANRHILKKHVSSVKTDMSVMPEMGTLSKTHDTAILPQDFRVPVLIVQHMPVQFTKLYAERLDSISNLNVKEAEHGDLLEAGTVYIARGGIHMKLKRNSIFDTRIELDMLPEDILYKPSVDIMMASVAKIYKGQTMGVIMTGMGNDGEHGMRLIKELGGKTLAQDAASCVVNGMPRAAIEAGVIDKIIKLEDIAGEILNMI
jgi:two-component system chemotaxis response regulator CheB